jgi:hypothetical protein
MLGPLIIGFVVCAVFLLLLPWGIKLLCRRFFHKDVSYFLCFWIALAIAMILCGITSHFYPQLW